MHTDILKMTPEIWLPSARGKTLKRALPLAALDPRLGHGPGAPGAADVILLMGSLALEKCFGYFHNLLPAESCVKYVGIKSQSKDCESEWVTWLLGTSGWGGSSCRSETHGNCALSM